MNIEVRYPEISTTPQARTAGPLPPVPVGPPESRIAEVIDSLPGVLPGWILDPVWKGVSGISKRLYRSGPPGSPQPPTPNSWKFSVIGDYGSPHNSLKDVVNNIIDGKPEVVLTVGDNVYYKGTEADWKKNWDAPGLFVEVAKRFPVMPSLGNHDVGVPPDPYFKRFSHLGNARYYSFDHGGVHFVSLDSNQALDPKSQQYSWLEKDLAGAKEGWKILYMHHPMYSGFSVIKTPLKDYLGPLLAKYGVDLVLSGHEHSYQRSKPLNSRGTIEVINGAGGHTLHPFINRKAPAHNAFRTVEFGHMEFEVTKDALVGRYLLRDGSVRDTFVLNRSF